MLEECYYCSIDQEIILKIKATNSFYYSFGLREDLYYSSKRASRAA
jgi:hypothetical protein